MSKLETNTRALITGKISRLIIWLLKFESSLILKDRFSEILQDHSRKDKLSLKGPRHEVVAVLSQFRTEVISQCLLPWHKLLL